MGPDSILTQQLEDQKLAVGQEVLARWNESCGRFCAQAKVVALRARSVQVELVRAAGGHPAGHRLELPRISDFEHWSSAHGVRLVKAG